MILSLGTCRSSCYQFCWVWFTFIFELLKISEIFRKRWRDFWGDHRAEARRKSKVKKHRGPNIICLAPRRSDCVNDLVIISWEQPGFMIISMNWLRMQASPPSSRTDAINISYSPIYLCKTFISMLGAHDLRRNFIYMMSIRRCHFMIFVRFVWSLLRARQRNHIAVMWMGLLIPSL